MRDETRTRPGWVRGFLVLCVSALLMMLMAPGAPVGAAPAPLAFAFDGGVLTFQVSTGAPAALAFPAGGDLAGTWDAATGDFDGVLELDGPAEVPFGGLTMAVNLEDEAFGDFSIPVTGTLPASGAVGELTADLWMGLDWVDGNSLINSTTYGPLEVTFDATYDAGAGTLDMDAAGITGPPIDGCGGGGCGYTFKDLATAWGLPASLFIQDATPYTWNNPGNSDNTLELGFSGAGTSMFSDVGPDHPFLEEITWMAESGISGGYDDGTFRPNAPVARQAMAAFLHRFAGEPAPTLVEPFFADVGPSHPFYTSIQWMAEAGLSTGTPNPPGKPLYKPGDAVSRQAMAAFLHRFSEDGPPTLADAFFADVTESHPFYNDVQWMAETELSTGTPNPPGKPLYKPGASVTRQAMAAFLFRMDALP